MRKYKQVKRKEVIFSMDEWKVVEDKAASVLMETGEFIRHAPLARKGQGERKSNPLHSVV